MGAVDVQADAGTAVFGHGAQLIEVCVEDVGNAGIAVHAEGLRKAEAQRAFLTASGSLAACFGSGGDERIHVAVVFTVDAHRTPQAEGVRARVGVGGDDVDGRTAGNVCQPAADFGDSRAVQSHAVDGDQQNALSAGIQPERAGFAVVQNFGDFHSAVVAGDVQRLIAVFIGDDLTAAEAEGPAAVFRREKNFRRRLNRIGLLEDGFCMSAESCGQKAEHERKSSDFSDDTHSGLLTAVRESGEAGGSAV